MYSYNIEEGLPVHFFVGVRLRRVRGMLSLLLSGMNLFVYQGTDNQLFYKPEIVGRNLYPF